MLRDDKHKTISTKDNNQINITYGILDNSNIFHSFYCQYPSAGLFIGREIDFSTYF